MDGECARLLPAVCAVLADARQLVSDDTCLEKMLDWFKALTEAESSLLLLQENPCLTELVTCVLKLEDPSPSIVSFILRLTGIFAASESCFQHLQQGEFLSSLFGEEGPINSSLWEDASVRSGWVEGVRSMVRHQSTIQFLCSSGAIDVIFMLQGDPSLFVASAVNRLLVHILTFSLQSETTSPLSMKYCSWPMCAQMIMAHIEESLKSSSVSRIKQALKLLTSVFGCCHDQWTEILWSRIAEPIESLLKEEPVQTGHSLVDLFLSMARSPVFGCPECSLWTSVTHALKFLNPAQAGPLALGVLKCQEWYDLLLWNSLFYTIGIWFCKSLKLLCCIKKKTFLLHLAAHVRLLQPKKGSRSPGAIGGDNSDDSVQRGRNRRSKGMHSSFSP
ncbi:BRCA1-associated ATM activator 1 isoform X2 [Alligator sinensis]|uniref:BRCA1-associated ATM activator 1 isoform X2 n=1 Tax=Alligator sinensis TaxID=38654 RepID=A0A1U7SMJ6_ALLSI|nr:BRCA1-associated ATM activator 1 isoform X2 [Alligator sinensis]